MAPGGPVLLGGALLAAIALLVSAGRRISLPRWVRAGGVVYAAVAVAIWLGGWAAQFREALAAR
jgi:protein-S-isoprenylcysteine O-methyltransferase Ste14